MSVTNVSGLQAQTPSKSHFYPTASESSPLPGCQLLSDLHLGPPLPPWVVVEPHPSISLTEVGTAN